MTAALLLLLKIAIGLIILAIGMDSSAKNALHLLHRPGLLVRSVLAMYVCVPLAAFLLVKLLPLAPGVKMGLLVLAASAGAPLLPRKLLRIGDGAYIFSLVLLSSLLSIFIVPFWLALLGPHFGTPLEIAPIHVAWVLAKSFLLPLAVGMLLRQCLPDVAERWGFRLLQAAGVLLSVAALAMLLTNWDVLLVARWGGVFALMVLVALALLIGHCLGGPAHDERTALALACASRHIGVAVLVAASLPGPRTIVVMAAYFLVSAVVCIPYLHWRRAVAARSHSTSTLSDLSP